MKALTSSVARILFALPMLIFGLFHFMNAGQMAGMVPGFIPGGVFWVYLTGLALIAAGVSFLINKYVKIAGLLLAIMLLIFVLTIHLPSVAGGNQQSMSALLKDFGLMAAALMVSGMGKD